MSPHLNLPPTSVRGPSLAYQSRDVMPPWSSSSHHSNTMYAPASPPTIIRRLSLYHDMDRAKRRFKPYERDGSTTWAPRFAEGHITPGNTDTSLTDVQNGKHLLHRGLRHLSSEAIAQALLTKEADLECRRLTALLTAWRIEASERHTKFLSFTSFLSLMPKPMLPLLQNLSEPPLKPLLTAARRNSKTARTLVSSHLTMTRRR
ncbi:hypothetical protein DEU56DRAFT_301097 [Suillus clintonianus]|uniref:uncharacterized protein n=1 Tax=Suillus clintonianus TaxID=1904413 RepID=UPI001B863C69|nr:uncharacterized protein DEU56DRAFT_301097 [Suillus clintonianus]KAG2139708.1 hypothetical protein DEU56DRAFT_301097 [Suillus clintonianus]